jgi:hypothetical protein
VKRWLVAVLLAACAAKAVAGNGWDELTAPQRSALAPLQNHWSSMDSSRRDKWIELAAKYPKMTAAERDRLQARMVEWARRTPTERGTARLQFQEAQRWTPEERQQRWEAYQSLDPQARQVLAERWRLEEAARAAEQAPKRADDKRNVVEVRTTPSKPDQAATPTAVMARSGATTQPMSRPRTEPPHHQPGVPKIAATPTFVDPATLLPKRGPQAAAVAPKPASSAAPAL